MISLRLSFNRRRSLLNLCVLNISKHIFTFFHTQQSTGLFYRILNNKKRVQRRYKVYHKDSSFSILTTKYFSQAKIIADAKHKPAFKQILTLLTLLFLTELFLTVFLHFHKSALLQYSLRDQRHMSPDNCSNSK